MALELHFHSSVFEYNAGGATGADETEGSDVEIDEESADGSGGSGGIGALVALVVLAGIAYGVRRAVRSRGEDDDTDAEARDPEQLTVAD